MITMDSLTHIVLGAAIGELVAGRKLGKKALVIGAVANSLPDLDFLGAFWLDTSRDVCFHRGITHSFLMVLTAAPLLAVLARRLFRQAAIGLLGWTLFFWIELFTHVFIDAFNTYGTGWFEPFDHYRVSFNALFVADPFYSVWLGLAALALVIIRRGHPARRRWAWFGLLMSTVYLGYGLANKSNVDRAVERQLAARGMADRHFFTTPTPFNCWLWYVVVADSTGFYTGYRSVFDAAERPVQLAWHPRNEEALDEFRARTDVGYLLRFSQGYYTV
ncbi:MAG TPA: metal-dependent hydrolase, partial [Puia sp.]|nr:metal-dependent hydrolase [Puia sp.]